jgi:hypothetical protein
MGSESDDVLWARLEEERRIRPTVVSNAQLVTIHQPAGPLLAGTLTVIWSLDAQRVQAVVGLAHDPTLVAEALSADLEANATVGAGDPLDRMPAFAELRYRGRTLVDVMVLPPDVATALDYVGLPWVGSPLDPEQLTVTSWVLPGAAPVSVAVLAAEPDVDDVERRLIAAIPAELSELGIEPAATVTVATRWVAKQAAKEVARVVIREGAQEAKERYDRWADRHEQQQERNRRLAEQRQAEQAREQRTRWRNGSFAPPDPLDPGRSVPTSSATVDELLQRRIAALRDTYGRQASE